MEVNVIELLQIIERQAKEIEQLKTRIKELEDLLSKDNKNSKNSSIPPSKNKFGERYRNEKKKEEKKVSEEMKKPKRNNLEISGTFRTQIGADNYLGIMSIISTLNKQKMPVLESLRKIFPLSSYVFYVL